jgi:hypothetical protein
MALVGKIEISPWASTDRDPMFATSSDSPLPANHQTVAGDTARHLRQPARKESEITMIGSWWFLWTVFLFLFLVPPIGYGWGYRGWGPHTRGISSDAAGHRHWPPVVPPRSTTNLGGGAETSCGWCFSSGCSGRLRPSGGAELKRNHVGAFTQTLLDMGSNQTSTIVSPNPIELIRPPPAARCR